VLCSVTVLPGKLHDFNIVVLPSKKPGCMAWRWISAEPIAHWSDPGQLACVSYPIYVSLVPALSNIKLTSMYQRCGLRPSVLGQDQSETKKSVLVLVWVLHAVFLVLHTAVFVLVLVLQVWRCAVTNDLVTLIIIMILKDTAIFQVLFIVSLFCVWNITTVEINSGVHLLKS